MHMNKLSELRIADTTLSLYTELFHVSFKAQEIKKKYFCRRCFADLLSLVAL